MDHRSIAALLQLLQQSLDLPDAQPQFLGGLALRDQPLLRLLQRHQPVTVGLGHQ